MMENLEPEELDEEESEGTTVAERLTSRKLIIGVITILTLAGLWLGTLAIDPSVVEASSFRWIAGLIGAAGGGGALLQYFIDRNGS